MLTVINTGGFSIQDLWDPCESRFVGGSLGAALLLVAAFGACAGPRSVSNDGAKTAAQPRRLELHSYRLLDTSTGTVRNLDELTGPKGAILFFAGTKCPVARAYEAFLPDLRAEAEANGLTLLMVSSNYFETPDDLRRHAQAGHLPFPIHQDVEGQLARALGAARTSETALFGVDGSLLYRGRMDDRFSTGAAMTPK